jgi:hypothetical protein
MDRRSLLIPLHIAVAKGVFNQFIFTLLAVVNFSSQSHLNHLR